LNALSEGCTPTAKPSSEKRSSSISDAAISIETSTTANTVTNNSILNRMYNMYKCNNMAQLKKEEDVRKTYDVFLRRSLQDQIDLVGKYDPNQKLYVAKMELATVEEHVVNYCLYNYRSSAYVLKFMNTMGCDLSRLTNRGSSTNWLGQRDGHSIGDWPLTNCIWWNTSNYRRNDLNSVMRGFVHQWVDRRKSDKAKLAASQLSTKTRGGVISEEGSVSTEKQGAESTDVDDVHSNKRNQPMGGRCTLHHNAAAYVVERGTAVCLL
jgi:uncharacterized protein YutD